MGSSKRTPRRLWGQGVYGRHTRMMILVPVVVMVVSILCMIAVIATLQVTHLRLA